MNDTVLASKMSTVGYIDFRKSCNSSYCFRTQHWHRMRFGIWIYNTPSYYVLASLKVDDDGSDYNDNSNDDSSEWYSAWRSTAFSSLLWFCGHDIACFVCTHITVFHWTSWCVFYGLDNKKLSWCWQTRATRLEVSRGHQTLYHSIC